MPPVYYDRAEARRMGFDSIQFGLVGHVAGGVVFACGWAGNNAQVIIIANVLIALATGVLVAGCSKYADYHERSRWWGLVGLLSFLGVVILLMLRIPSQADSRRGEFEITYLAPYHRDVWRMDVRVLLDETLNSGIAEAISLQLPRGATVTLAVRTLAGALPALKREPTQFRYEINSQPAKPADELSDGDALVIRETENPIRSNDPATSQTNGPA